MDTPLRIISFSELIFSDAWFLIYLTVPFMVIFLITIISYFFFIDKHKPIVYNEITHKKDKDASSMPGRRLMMLFFILFFLVLLSIIIQFATAYIIEYDSMYSRGVANGEFYPIPFNILINTITACTMLFIGVEGSVASISTFQLAKGQMVKLPALKRSRVYTIVFLWLFTTIIAVTYHFILGSNTIDFKLDELFMGLSTSIVLLFASDKAPNVFKNFGKDGLNIKSDKNNTVNNDDNSDMTTTGDININVNTNPNITDTVTRPINNIKRTNTTVASDRIVRPTTDEMVLRNDTIEYNRMRNSSSVNTSLGNGK